MRLNALIFSTVVLLFCQTANAVSFGEIKINSYLNQKLDASIKVVGGAQFPLSKFKIEHAAYRDYRKFGLNMHAYVDDVFLAMAEENDQLMIKLSSRKIIREPLLSLILTIRWPEGNLSKEVNLFLNPPVSINPVQTTKVQTSLNTKTNKNNKTTIVAQIDIDSSKQKSEVVYSKEYRKDLSFDLQDFRPKQRYGAIKSGESITLIAQKIRPDRRYSIQKISKLLFLLNRSSFVGNNINQIKVGSYLQLPDLNNPELLKDTYRDSVLEGQDSQTAVQENLELNLTEKDKEARLSIIADEEQSELSKVADSLVQVGEPDDEDIVQDAERKTQISDDLVQANQMVTQLSEENNLLKNKLDLLILKVESVVAQNQKLDQKISELTGRSILGDSKLPHQESTEDVQYQTFAENSEQEFLQEKNDTELVTNNEESNQLSEQTGSEKTTGSEQAKASDTETAQQSSETKFKKQTNLTNDDHQLNDKQTSTTKDNSASWIDSVGNFISAISGWLIGLLLLLLSVILVGFLWFKTNFGEKVKTYYYDLKGQYFPEKYVQEEFDFDEVLANDSMTESQQEAKQSDSSDVSGQEQEDEIIITSTEEEQNEIPDDFIFESELNEKETDEVSGFDLDLGEPEEKPSSVYVSPVQSMGGSQVAAGSSVQGESVQNAASQVTSVQGSSVQAASVQNAVSGVSVQNSAVQSVSVQNVSQENSSDTAVNFADILGMEGDSEPGNKSKVDLLSQASVYFAYGKFDLAEQLIIKGIQDEPTNKVFHLKLFECYSKRDDEENFMAYLETVKTMLDSDEDFKASVEKLYHGRWNKQLF